MKRLVLYAFLALVLGACSSMGGAPEAIERYIQALIAKDVVGASGSSCLEWEESAYAEASSFEAVEVTVEGLDCVEDGTEAEFTRVRCTGTIVANYGGELQDIDLSKRTYLAANEAGEWKMCGYSTR